MSQTPISTTETRYLGVDLHKHYLVIGGVNARQVVVLAPRRVELDDWLAWAQQHLRQTDVLVVEADEVVDRVACVEVANAGKIALIAQTRVTLALAGKCQGDRQARRHEARKALGGGPDPGSVGAARAGA